MVEQLENLLLPFEMHDLISKKCSLGLIYFDQQPLDSLETEMFPVFRMFIRNVIIISSFN